MKVATLSLKDLLQEVMQNTSVQDKIAIYRTHSAIGNSIKYQDPFNPDVCGNIKVGDDCAAIPDGRGGYLLFAAEGIIPPFLDAHPWFAGYSAVLVNISDICAMGGLPMALTDVLWVKDSKDGEQIWEGMKAASETYSIPIVGGHTCYHSDKKHLAVSILGKANQLLTSYNAEAEDVLLMAVDLDGQFYNDYPFWNASTETEPTKLRHNMGLLRNIAEEGWSKTAKDISMGGIVGTLAMLIHTSKVGAYLNLDDVPKPIHVPFSKWLISFPSYGFLLSAKMEHVTNIIKLFNDSQIACAAIGKIEAQPGLSVSFQGEMMKVL